MKKINSLLAALVMCTAAFAADLELPIANLSATAGGWGDVTVSNGTITFGSDWSGGAAWWIGGDDWSAYNYMVIELEPVNWQVALNVEYGTADTSNGYEQEIGTANAKTIKIALNASKKNAVQKVYIQSGAAGNVTIKKAYVQGDDPYSLDGRNATKMDYDEYGGIRRPELEKYAATDIVEIIINCTDASKELGWGIAKIVALNDWENVQTELMNKCNGIGQSKFYFTIAEIINFAKKGTGTWYTDSYGDSGVHIGAYSGSSELVSINCWTKGTGFNEVKASTDIFSKTSANIYTLLNGTANYAVYNVTGQMVMQGMANQINVSELPHGMYILRAAGASMKITKE